MGIRRKKKGGEAYEISRRKKIDFEKIEGERILRRRNADDCT